MGNNRGASLFRTSHLIAGDLNGKFAAVSDTDYNFDAEVDYVYYRDPLFKRPDIEKADGLGWAFDLAGEWQPSDAWTLAFRPKDLFARIKWEDAPFTEARASTNQKSYDDEGCAVFAPLLSGREGYRETYWQEIDPRYGAAVTFGHGNLTGHLRGQYQFDYGLIGLGVGRRFANGVELRGLAWPEVEAVGLEFEYGAWQGGLAVDHVEWQDMQSIAFSVSYGY